MLKSTTQKIAIAFSSIAAVLSACYPASAQLNVGRYGIQKGLEQEYLQYQIKNPNLDGMRVIPGCDIGFGLTCNKTGSVIQKILELNGGPSYQDLITRAAGGQQNLQNFAGFYNNNPNLPAVPYASFWKNQTPSIMDGYQYVLGESYGRTPVAGLAQITKNFYWSPYTGSNNAVSLRNALVDLKLSYGRLLFEEAAKVPNIQQQIRALGLSPNMTKFYVNNVSQGLNALSSGNQNRLQDSIFETLSYPYPEYGGEFGRPINAIPQELSQLTGVDVPGDILVSDNPIALDGELLTLDTPSPVVGEVLAPETSDGFPLWPIIGGAGLGLLLLLLLSGGDSSSGSQSSVNTSVPPTSPPSNECIPSSNGNDSSNNGQVIEVPCKPNNPPTSPEVKKVVEPSMFKALLLLVVLLFIMRHKKRSITAARNS